MKIKYRDFKFRGDTLAVIEKANEIINSYQKQGYNLTLRQLFYQFVSKALIPNTEKSYKRLGGIINDGRLAGMISWEAIEDRTRELRGNPSWNNPGEIIESCIWSYHLNMWENQSTHIEVWVEKDALLGVIETACDPLDVDYFSCRGYVSQSEMWKASQRLKWKEEKKETIIFHLGDHDPSGIDMTRDIQDRLKEFGSDVEVKRIALTMTQIKKFKPPPNPAKITDSRATGYIKKYGNKSWELDALEPSYITKLIGSSVAPYVDKTLWKWREDETEDGKNLLRKLAKNWKRYKK